MLGIPDERAPEIRAEVEEVAEALPGARLFIGPAATEERLRELGGGCRLLHIATHGFFRRDNPMFSAIQLGASRLTLFDLYNLELGAELVVLSGCGTGSERDRRRRRADRPDPRPALRRSPFGPGHPLGRHDRSTTTFMRAFYAQMRRASRTGRGALATRHARAARRVPQPLLLGTLSADRQDNK